MEQFAWLLWTILGVFLVITEIFTLGFVLFWFGLGALAAALAAYLGAGFFVQFLIFALISIILTIMSRTIFENYPRSNNEDLKMGIDKLPGKIATVKKASKGALNAASVRAYGTNWKAFPVDENIVLAKGEKVEIVRVEGAAIYVRKANKESLGWRDDEI